MANIGRFDFSQLKQLQNKLNRLSDPDGFIDECAKELAARLLESVIEKTKPGQYPSGSGKVGGTLRRGWTAKTHDEAAEGTGDGKDPAEWADSLPIKQYGNTVCIEVSNPVEYASYVEYGHRTRNHKSWVTGKFMLTISSEEIQSLAPAMLENKIKNYLREFF